MNQPTTHSPTGLRRFSKITCFSTLFLIFVGGMVTSTDSGLAVPDWPLSYGTLFPPMVGGIFYEHSHRMVAATVGLMMLILAIWLGVRERRNWVRYLGYWALLAVVLQGILGGITVLFYLPTPISVIHGVFAQTFFILTIMIAYSQSKERTLKDFPLKSFNPLFIKCLLTLILSVYMQLIMGAVMRHTGSGLAIPDFPTMGGQWLPRFDDAMLMRINHWRFHNNLEDVTKAQVTIHFVHRIGAAIITLGVCLLTILGLQYYRPKQKIIRTIYLLNIFVFMQILLGIMTVLTIKSPVLTSLHVVNGAGILGLSVLLCLRVSPNSWNEFKRIMIGSNE